MSPKQLISERERQLAIHELEGFHERGFIDDLEFRDRKMMVEDAKTADQVAPWLADLRAGRRGRRELRITTHERAAAIRRLKIHRDDGQLSPDECQRRIDLVEGAHTAAEIREMLSELPPLKPARERPGDRLVSRVEREDAVAYLEQARDEGRLDAEQHADRVETVGSARTRNEIQSAFRGIPPQRLGKQRRIAKDAGHAVVRTGILLARGVVIAGWISLCSLIVRVWLLSGIGMATSVVLIVLITVVSLGLLRVPGLRRGGVDAD